MKTSPREQIRKENTNGIVGKSLGLRPYQQDAYSNRRNGIECWIWGRQTGKSYTLAAWAIDRMVSRPGRLITVLSNSFTNGVEFNQKCAEISRLYARVVEERAGVRLQFETLSDEIRLERLGAVSRVKVLAANPRTARGFSGDLILDEFAFHEDGDAIWEAAEPILAANPDYLCRVASTPNGRQNTFYRLATGGVIPTRVVRRSDAFLQGLIIAHPVTRKPITPEEARALAPDKRAYDQNYECVFGSENMALLTQQLISEAEDPSCGVVCDDRWSEQALAYFGKPANPHSVTSKRNLYIGVDVGRSEDLTVITVVEKLSSCFVLRALLRLRNMRLPEQQEHLERALLSPCFASAQIDMSGLGLGLFEYTHRRFGERVRGLNFSSLIALDPLAKDSPKVKVPESLALTLLHQYEEKRIRQPVDNLLREDLRKPERIVTSEGRTSIFAPHTRNGHADHFWSLALAVDAGLRMPVPKVYIPRIRNFMKISRKSFC
jgi:phage FluMu gp28-like protein